MGSFNTPKQAYFKSYYLQLATLFILCTILLIASTSALLTTPQLHQHNRQNFFQHVPLRKVAQNAKNLDSNTFPNLETLDPPISRSTNIPTVTKAFIQSPQTIPTGQQLQQQQQQPPPLETSRLDWIPQHQQLPKDPIASNSSWYGNNYSNNDDEDSIEIASMSTINASATAKTTFENPINTTENPTTNKTAATTSYNNVHPLLIYSIRYEIKSYDLYNLYSPVPTSNARRTFPSSSFGGVFHHSNSAPVAFFDQPYLPNRQSKTLIAGLKNTIGLDFYYSDNESFIFWTDVIEERIYKGTIINGTITNVEMLVQTGLATAEGLAVDWIGLNIYWVESTLDHIEVASMNGSNRRTLIAGDMESPRAIAVDPRYGFLFWTDWDKRSPRIERATLSGEDRKTLVYIKEVNGGWPNGLTLDYDLLKIYWIDANSDSIHVVDYEGNNHQPILRAIKSLGHPFSITLYENNLFWTDWKTNSVSIANKINGSDARELHRLTNRLFDIKVFHPNRQPKIDNKLNPCFINNGNCSNLCLLSTNHTRKCECPHLMKLARDNLTCVTNENVLLIGRTNEIRAVDLSQPLHYIMAPISVPKVFNPRQFEYDSKSKTIFWADSQTNEVKRTPLVGNSIDTIIDVIIDAPSGLALDWISGNIYVTSVSQQKASASGKIFISNLNGEYISILMDSSQGIISPKSLAVHPKLGLLFCVDENEDSEPIIFIATMDGRGKRIITSKKNNPRLENPTSLSMDYDLDRLYWINQANNVSDKNSIQYYEIHSDTIYTVLDNNDLEVYGDIINPSVLCVDGDYLIVSGRVPAESIVKISKHNILERTVMRTQNLEQITTIRVYNATSQIGTNACGQNNGNCSQLCVPTNSTSRTCKCTMGYTINPLNETECTGKDLFLIFSYNQGMKGISLEPNSSSDDYYLPPIHRAFRASSIDYVHRNNLIYWVDNEEGSITRINRDTTNYQVIVQGLESEESIAIDWVAGNIYWLDPYYDIIEVARLNGSNRYVIVSGEMDKANGIVVNPIKGYIVWSDIGSNPKIETAQLDGSNRRVIVSSNLSQVDDLAIDYEEDYIYWVDSTLSLIERVKQDGTQRQVVYSSSSNQQSHNHLVSIAIYKNYLFIADSVQHQGSIIRCEKHNASNKKIIQQHLGDGIRDIAIFAEQPLPSPEENSCVKDNGGCQDLCLFSGQKGRSNCVCSHGKLTSDGKTCKPSDTFVMFSKLSSIDSLHIKEDESFNNAPYLPITIENKSSIISLTIDYKAQRVIYSDIAIDQISSILFNGTERIVLVEKQSLVEGIAFANDQLYWTSIYNNSISRLQTTSLGQRKKICDESICRTASVEKIIQLTWDDKPRGIAIDSCTSYIYWTNWNAMASIQRASPQTGYKIESIIKTNIKVPNGITIDQKQRKLYWCDARLDKIETCDMDGTNRVILISAAPQHPFALAIWDKYIFWTDWLARGVFKADKFTGQQPFQVKKLGQRPMGIAVAAPETIECSLDLCSINNGGCPIGFACIMHHLSPTGSVECRPRTEISHEVSLPAPKCKYSKNGSCHTSTYHDIIMDMMDRYNLTDLVPLESKSLPSESSTERFTTSISNSTNEASSEKPATNYSTTAINDQIGDTQSMKKLDANANDSMTTVNSNNIKELNSEKTTTAYKELTTNVPPVSSSTPPSITKTTTETVQQTSPAAPSQYITITNALPNETTTTQTQSPSPSSTVNSSLINTPTQAPLTTNASLTPCMIVPAALQPTTESSTNSDCLLPGQYKCYLSEKLVCISGEKRCDGNHDCPSKEDENDCALSKRGPYSLKRETHWHRYVTVILVILAAAIAALFLVFGSRGRRRWFVMGTNGAFSHRRMFDDNGTNIEISNPMFDEDDSGNLVHCAFSIDLNERTTNFSNPLYERQVLLMNDKHVTSN